MTRRPRDSPGRWTRNRTLPVHGQDKTRGKIDCPTDPRRFLLRAEEVTRDGLQRRRIDWSCMRGRTEVTLSDLLLPGMPAAPSGASPLNTWHQGDLWPFSGKHGEVRS